MAEFSATTEEKNSHKLTPEYLHGTFFSMQLIICFNHFVANKSAANIFYCICSQASLLPLTAEKHYVIVTQITTD